MIDPPSSALNSTSLPMRFRIRALLALSTSWRVGNLDLSADLQQYRRVTGSHYNSVASKSSPKDRGLLSALNALIDFGVSLPSLISFSILANAEIVSIDPIVWGIQKLTGIFLTEDLS